MASRDLPKSTQKRIEKGNQIIISKSDPPEIRKTGKIVKGAVRQLNSTGKTRKLSETPMGKHIMDALQFALHEVAIPAAKDMIYGMITGGGERLIYRDDDVRNRSGYSNSRRGNGYYSYSSLSDPNRTRRAERDIPPWEERTSRSSRDVNDIVVSTRDDAIEVLCELKDIIDSYGFATVANLKDLVGITERHTDHKWGWESIEGSTYRRVRDGGYLLILPRVIEIK